MHLFFQVLKASEGIHPLLAGPERRLLKAIP
jgi:hypothetical protein